MSVKIMTAREAMDLVPDGATVATGGFIGASFGEELAMELENRFLAVSYTHLSSVSTRSPASSTGMSRIIKPLFSKMRRAFG